MWHPDYCISPISITKGEVTKLLPVLSGDKERAKRTVCFQGIILQALREEQEVSRSTICGCQCPALFWNTVTPALVVPAHVLNLEAAGFKSLSSLFDLERFSVWACTWVCTSYHTSWRCAATMYTVCECLCVWFCTQNIFHIFKYHNIIQYTSEWCALHEHSAFPSQTWPVCISKFSKLLEYFLA